MDHVFTWKVVCVCQFGLAGIAPVECLAFLQQFWSGGPVNGAVHAAPSEQAFVCGIYDRFHIGDLCDVSLYHTNFGFFFCAAGKLPAQFHENNPQKPLPRPLCHVCRRGGLGIQPDPPDLVQRTCLCENRVSGIKKFLFEIRILLEFSPVPFFYNVKFHLIPGLYIERGHLLSEGFAFPGLRCPQYRRIPDRIVEQLCLLCHHILFDMQILKIIDRKFAAIPV